MKAMTQQVKTIKKNPKKELTLLDEFKLAFEDIKHGRMREWKFDN
jgi:hypothetical protein